MVFSTWVVHKGRYITVRYDIDRRKLETLARKAANSKGQRATAGPVTVRIPRPTDKGES